MKIKFFTNIFILLSSLVLLAPGASRDENDKITPDAHVNSIEERTNMPSYNDILILQQTIKERGRIEKLRKQLSFQEKLISIKEQKLTEKKNELNKIKTNIEQLMKIYNKEKSVNLRSLVSAYEKMKPSIAAGIFSTMEYDHLLPIVRKMRPKQLAQIMNFMPSTKVKELTLYMTQ